MQGQKTLSFYYNMHLFLPYLINDSQTIRSAIHFSYSQPQTSRPRTTGWTSDAYGTQKWKHFRSFEVVIGLVELYRISGRCVYRVLKRFAWKQRCRDAKPPRKRIKSSCLQLWLNAGFSKVCEILKVCSIESFKYVREFYTPVCYCGDISMPRNVTLDETN